MGCWTYFEPLPRLSIHMAATREGLCRLALQVSSEQFVGELRAIEGETEWRREDHPLLEEAKRQLVQYFRGDLRQFRLPLDLRGTEFQKKVWQSLLDIPYGARSSYADIARMVGSPKAVRAVGGANGANPIAIIVPCHRVVASDGGLGGYSAGLDTKRKLLALEAGAA